MVPEAQRAGELLAEKLRSFGGADPTPEQRAEIEAETNALLAGLKARVEEARAEQARQEGLSA